MAGKGTSRAQTVKAPASAKSGARTKGLDIALALAPFAAGALKKLMENPALAKGIQEQFDRLRKHSGDSGSDLLETVKVLREQVDYLVESADDEREAARAATWSKQLEQCERAARLVSAPGATRKERRALKKRITGLRTEILEAFIAEQEEDAEADKGTGSPES